MNLYPHQQAAVDWLRARPRAGLFDDQGLGKTAVAIVAARSVGVGGRRRVLVIAPAIATVNWVREIEAWAPGERVQRVTTGRDKIDRAASWVVVSHALAVSRSIDEQLYGFDVTIVDEAHAFRNPTAARTQAMLLGANPIARRTGTCWLLTGTPCPNSPAEVWTYLAALAPDRLRGEDGRLLRYTEWRDRFCVTVPDSFRPWQVRILGARNVPEFRQRLDGFALRRLKRDVLTSLPPMRHAVVAVEAKVPGDEPAELHDDADLHRAAGDAGWATWRHECGLAKVDPAVALMEAELAGDPDRKVILVAHHLDVIEGLRTGLHAYGATTIVGSLSQLERARRVERFQVDPACRVIVLQLHAGGTAITLTAAQDVVFVEASTVPGDNAQVADRAHRIGQQGSVLCRYLSVAGSADEAVARILARKTEALRSIGLGGGA